MTAAPDPGTCAAELVEIGELLICFAQSNSEARVEIRTKLMRKSNALAERLKVTDGAILQPVTHRQSPRALARAERAQVRKFLTETSRRAEHASTEQDEPPRRVSGEGLSLSVHCGRAPKPVNNTDPTGFITANEAGTAYGAFHLPATMTGFATGSGLGPFSTGISLGRTLLGGRGGTPGGSYSITPTSAPANPGTTTSGLPATGQNGSQPGPRRAISDLPGYSGGAPPTNTGGSEGAGGGPSAEQGPGFNPGPYVKNGKLSSESLNLLREVFDRFGYDVARVSIQFGRVSSGAKTNGDLIHIDKGLWAAKNPLEQMQLLVHEVTHSVQFDKLGHWRVRLRLGWERIRYGFDGVYDVPGALDRINKVADMNLVDPRFTLEAIATRMEGFARTGSVP